MELIAALRAEPVLFTLVVALFGLLVGSFLNVVIYRLPLMLERQWRAESAELLAGGDAEPAPAAPPGPRFNLVTPASACPGCRAPIKPWHNIPVVSWLALRGRCAACGTPISVRYPLVELLTGLVFGAVAWRFGWARRRSRST